MSTNGFKLDSGEKREDYSSLLAVGLGLALLMLIALAVYWIGDPPRLQAAAASLSQERIERGDALYASQCASCHGLEGEGGLGPALKNRTVLKNTPDEIFFSVIRSGVPNTQMPSWSVDFGGPLTDEDIQDLVALLRSWEATAPEILPQQRQPDPAQGALLFASTCALCHGENGSGGSPGVPALNAPERLEKFDDDWYRSVIANGRPARGMPTWGTVLSPAQIDDLVALLSAWRDGREIQPAYSMADLLDQALFALSENDNESALLRLSRALEASTGRQAELLREIQAQITSGDAPGAVQSLAALKENWPPGDPQAGAQIYAVQCASCHGPQGEGGIGKVLQASNFIQSQSTAELVTLIQEGRPGTLMAGFADRLSEQEIADIVAWVRELQK